MKPAAMTTWAAEDWTVRGFAGRDLFEFGRAHGFEEPPTNEMRITRLDGTQVVASAAPFIAGLAEPSAAGTSDGQVLVIGRPCTTVSRQNIDSSGIECMDKALAAAIYDIATDSWESVDVPAALTPRSAPTPRPMPMPLPKPMPKALLVGFVDGVAYVTTYPESALGTRALRGAWNVDSGEVVVGDAEWSNAEIVESCVLADGTRYDVRSVGTAISSGEVTTNVEIYRTSTDAGSTESPVAKTFDQPVALRCDEKSAIVALLPNGTRPQTVERASDLVSGADVSAAIKGTVVLPGVGSFVGTDEAHQRTVLLGSAGPFEFGAAIGGYTISNGVDVLFVDNVGAENVALVRTDSADKIDADRLAKLIPTPPKFVNKVGEPTTTTTK